MVDYFAADADHTIAPDTAQRAVGVRVSAPDADGYDVGRPGHRDPVVAGLQPRRARRGHRHRVVRATRAQLGAGHPRLHVNFDEIGTATVQFTIPAGASGPTRFDVTASGTPTASSFTVPVDVAVP